jgi:hypothetical protein
MWTYTSLQEACSAFLDGFTDDFFGTMFPICVRQAEERILHVTKLQPLRRREAVVVLPGIAVIGAFPELIAPVAVSAGFAPLLYRTTDWINEVFGANATPGTPGYYAIQPKLDDQKVVQIIVAPPATAGVTYEVEYLAKPLSLVDAPSGTWISTNCENALLYGVLLHAYLYEKGETDVMAAYKEEFEKALSLLKGLTYSNMRIDEFRLSPQAAPEA